MKLRNKTLLIVAIFVLAIPMAAGADRYKGDGATQNATSGRWDLPPVSPAHSGGTDTFCLECHGSGNNQYDCGGRCLAPDKSSYLLTGHRNLLRKVTPGKPWAGPAGIYTEDISGSTFDWVSGKIIIDGVAHKLFYAMGDWMAPEVIAIYDKNNDGKTAWTTEDEAYGTCARCHVTGYGSEGATEPAASHPTIKEGITGSWWLDSVQCERCHRDSGNDYGGHNCYVNGVVDPTKTNHSDCVAAGGTYSVNVPTGRGSTVLCGECHHAKAGWEGAANPNAATQTTAYPIRTSATGFSGHVIGKQFLNSPHGLFTGTYDQVGSTTAGLYNSHFSDGTCSVAGEYLSRSTCEAAGGTWTSFQGGCTTCHDAHQSIVPEVKENFGAEPMKRGCGIACHSSRASKINHSSGIGTPMEKGTEAACATCHMPKPVGATTMMHVFRISTDPDYSTFAKQVGGVWTPGYCTDPSYKTKATCDAAGKTWYGVANTAPEGTYRNAVWVDLDLACGQCHGGGARGEGAKVFPLSKKQLAHYAEHMHGDTNTAPTAAMAAAPTVTGLTVTFTDKSSDRQDQGDLRIKVSWGDGKFASGISGRTFEHKYKKAGTYTIRHTATDAEGVTGYESVKVVVPSN